MKHADKFRQFLASPMCALLPAQAKQALIEMAGDIDNLLAEGRDLIDQLKKEKQ